MNETPQTNDVSTDSAAIQRAIDREQADWAETRDLLPSVEKVRLYTMVPLESLVELARVVQTVLAEGIPGAFVECGVWRGGCSFLMADLLRQAGARDRKVWLFDSFEGLPPPQEIDGAAAGKYTEEKESPRYFDNCRAGLEEARQAAASLGLDGYTEFVKGWFEETLPANRDRVGPIAVLRIDGDWYSSVRCCLESLYDRVVDGGLILLDDYFAFDGCAVAMHEFLGSRRLAHRIEPVVGKWEGAEHYQSALFRKGGSTWQWMRQIGLTKQEIAQLIPAEETFILVDEEWMRDQVGRGRRALPFLEREGQYFGRPADDATALAELERLRQMGANFLVFAWPAFWWLDHYATLRDYLHSRSRCLLANDRLIVFDLRR